MASLSYCEPNVTVLTVWSNHGFSHCFLDTLSSVLIGAFAGCLGLAEISMYWRYSTAVEPSIKPKTWLYYLHIVTLSALLILPVFEFSIYATVLHSPTYGYLILWDVVQLLCWGIVIMLLYWERNYDLPSPPARGHGAIMLITCAAVFVTKNLALVNINSPKWWWQLVTHYDHVKLGIFVSNYFLCFLAFLLGLRAPGIASADQRAQFAHRRLKEEEESEPLTASRGSTFRNFTTKLKTISPYLWPKGQYLLQLRVFLCILLLIAGRLVNVYVPQYSKWIVNSLTYEKNVTKLQLRWDYILAYVALRFTQGGAGSGGGLLNITRSFLWIRVQQFTTREIQVQLYRHLHCLSIRWHLGRKTGEVLRVMDRGTNSINNILSYILFQIGPTIADIVIAIVYFTTAFNAWFGLIVLITMIIYLTSTIVVTEWRTKFRRNMNRLDNETTAKGVDSLLNFETVKYYGAEDYEVDRYRKSLLSYQEAEFLSSASLSALNMTQNFIINIGLLAGSLLCAHMVVVGQDGFNVGDYVLFAAYIMQLYQPLNWLGNYYRSIQQAFIDMENMFDLLNESQEVKDLPDAEELNLKQGRIEFRNVSFHYVPERPVLKNISFIVEPGKTLALVGPSGSGKSTIIRLLFRFYDVNSGSIYFDNQDITTVTQKSVRQHIGVVPQDTVLFNDTILYNVRYGRVTASDEEVFEAADAADINERIQNFPDKYSTKVGERGLKLSGGEKQRVAIARTILKAPTFVLLDEATSALDTKTERNIQASLNKVCAGRTTVIVAHRLSTIVHADEIIVIKDGSIIERGSHENLLSQEGLYADMWIQQSQTVDELSANGDAGMGSRKATEPRLGGLESSVLDDSVELV